MRLGAAALYLTYSKQRRLGVIRIEVKEPEQKITGDLKITVETDKCESVTKSEVTEVK